LTFQSGFLSQMCLWSCSLDIYSSAFAGQMAGNMVLADSQCHVGQVATRNKVLGGRHPGMISTLSCLTLLLYQPDWSPVSPLCYAAPFAAGERCPQSRRQHATTTCQAGEAQQVVNRRGLLSAGISLAAAAQLQSASPADALVVSKEWEKVCSLQLPGCKPLFASMQTHVKHRDDVVAGGPPS